MAGAVSMACARPEPPPPDQNFLTYDAGYDAGPERTCDGLSHVLFCDDFDHKSLEALQWYPLHWTPQVVAGSYSVVPSTRSALNALEVTFPSAPPYSFPGAGVSRSFGLSKTYSKVRVAFDFRIAEWDSLSDPQAMVAAITVSGVMLTVDCDGATLTVSQNEPVQSPDGGGSFFVTPPFSLPHPHQTWTRVALELTPTPTGSIGIVTRDGVNVGEGELPFLYEGELMLGGLAGASDHANTFDYDNVSVTFDP